MVGRRVGRRSARRVLLVFFVASAALAAALTGSTPLSRETPLETASLRTTTAMGIEGRVEVSDAFAVSSTRLSVSPRVEPPVGTADAPVSIANPPSVASTALDRDHWELVLVLHESRPDSALPGRYAASLEFDGRPAGTVILMKTEHQPNVTGGAWLVYDIGAEISRSSLYVLAVEPTDAPSLKVAYRIESDPSGDLTWRGLGAMADATNPILRVAKGDSLQIEWTNRDGILHDLLVRGPDGKTVAGPTRDADASGDGATLTWIPTEKGRYEYACRYHAASMRGVIEVT